MNSYIKQGDCLELMKEIPDKSVDMILADLPYGTSACKWDSIIPFEPLWKEYERIIKDDGAILLFGLEPFASKCRMSNLAMYKYDWIWDKDRAANFLNCNHQPLKVHELIMVFGKGATSYSSIGKYMKYNPQMDAGTPYVSSGRNQNTGPTIRTPLKGRLTVNNGERYPTSILSFKKDKSKLHQTQKPVALLEYLIKTYTNEGETVLDNVMGSGSTCVAAINTNRKYIGFEIDGAFFNVAEQRIKEAESKRSLS